MTEEERSYLGKKLEALRLNQKIHYAASERYQKINWLIGSLVVIISTGVGSFAFSDLATMPSYWSLIISLGSLVSAVLAAILTYSGFSEIAARHKYAGTHYGYLVRTVESWLASGNNERDWQESFDELNDKWSEISDAAPITYCRDRQKRGES